VPGVGCCWACFELLQAVRAMQHSNITIAFFIPSENKAEDS
jgi:hypothetical protein